jgi:hypothetical protein
MRPITNPNATTRVPVETLLPSLIGNFLGSSSAAGSAMDWRRWPAGGRYIQYFETNTTAQYIRPDGRCCTGASDNMGSIWAMHYYGQGQNLNRW